MIETGHLLIAVTVTVFPILAYLRRIHRYTIGHLAAIALFTAYLVGVAHYTVLPVRFDSGDELAGMEVSRLVSLVPFFLPGGGAPSGQVLGNILLGVPFGFGLPFVHRLAPQKVAIAGLVFAGSIELIQLGLDVLHVAAPPRSVDINDVVFNATGAALGVASFWLASRLYRSAFSGRALTYPLWAHFHRTFVGEARAERSIDGS